jgi:sugar lactone lactonase YvrE
MNARNLAAVLAAALTASAALGQGLTLSTLAGQAAAYGFQDGTGANARFDWPGGICLDPSGNIILADTYNCSVRKITPAGVVTTVSGFGGYGGGIDGAVAIAQFNHPIGVGADSSGNIYVADSQNGAVRMISNAGLVTTYGGYINQFGHVDDYGTNARFERPTGIAVDSAGIVYVVDDLDNTVRRIDTNHLVTTLAGSSNQSGSSDGNGPQALFNAPSAVAVDTSGNLYVADTLNDTIRRVTPTGSVTTLAGSPGTAGFQDGQGGAAQFNRPQGIAIDGSGNLYVADTGNNVLRRITPSGAVTTVAGSATGPTQDVNGIGTAASLEAPLGIDVSPQGVVYFTDSLAHTLREATAGVPLIGSSFDPQSASVGQAATFTVQATGAAPLAYQWSFNGTPIPGATGATYTTHPLLLSDAGTYSVAVTNGQGSATASASLAVTFPHNSVGGFTDWTATTELPTTTAYTSVAFNGSAFLAVGLDGTAFHSSDGLHWSASPSNGPPGQTWGELNNVTAVPGKSTWVAVGNGGAVVSFASGTFAGTQVASPATSILTGVAANGSTLIAVGYGGACITSGLNASSWTAQNTGTSQNLNAVAFGAGTFVAVGLGGTIVTSPDGAAWTAHSLAVGTNLYGVAYGYQEFVAVGDGGAVYQSPDGVTWTERSSPTSNILVHVASGDGTFVAVGLSGTVLVSSDGGISWQAPATGTAARLDGIALGNDIFVATGDSGVDVTSVESSASRLVNLSARANVETGSGVLIAGFVVGGSGTKQVLVRGVGPTLSNFGVTQTLALPMLSLDGSAGNTLDTNTAWGGGSTLIQAFSQVGAFALDPASPDTAILTPLGAGSYTAILSGRNSSTGVGLAEIYDADAGPSPSRLINLSARASVGSGGGLVIGGFVISGTTPETVLIRGIGPTLGQFGVTGALAAPQLALYDTNNDVLATNSGWGGTTALSQVFTQVNAFALPASSADAAILVTLPPGAYTAELTGLNGSSGVALVEIYEVR